MVMRSLALAVAAALLAACTVGPDFVRPDMPTPEHFAQAGTTEAAAADGTPAQNGSFELVTDNEFWRGFNDALLTRLVEEALSANHDLRIGLANYDRANALLRGAKFDYFPTITAFGEASDGRASADQAPGVSRADRDAESYSAGAQVSWELDLFGRVRRSVEASRAGASASAADLQAMQVAIVGEVARSYATCADCRNVCAWPARTPRTSRKRCASSMRASMPVAAPSSIPRVQAHSSKRRVHACRRWKRRSR